MNLDQKRFVAINNESGLSSDKTLFEYSQTGTVITGKYRGGAIREGFIVGKQTGATTIELLFQCLTNTGELKVGESTGEVLTHADGTLELRFTWNWLNGDRSGGTSAYREVE